MLPSWASGEPLVGERVRIATRSGITALNLSQPAARIQVLPAIGERSHAETAIHDPSPESERKLVREERSKGMPYFILKRWVDVILASLALIVLVPVLLLVALLIKLDSPGPVFFTHERVGAKRRRKGREAVWVIENFGMHKFRSMFQNADSRVHEAYIRDFVEGRVTPTEEGGKFKLTNDPRVTRVGRWLRRMSLDELPQLFNVLKGQMSLVGPRPVPPYEVACYKNSEYHRLAALPGITGFWQVNGRCQVSFEEMVRMDIEYIRDASLWLDVRILFRTIPAVLCGRGAE